MTGSSFRAAEASWSGSSSFAPDVRENTMTSAFAPAGSQGAASSIRFSASSAESESVLGKPRFSSASQTVRAMSRCAGWALMTICTLTACTVKTDADALKRFREKRKRNFKSQFRNPGGSGNAIDLPGDWYSQCNHYCKEYPAAIRDNTYFVIN